MQINRPAHQHLIQAASTKWTFLLTNSLCLEILSLAFDRLPHQVTLSLHLEELVHKAKMETDELRRWGDVAVFLKVYGVVVGIASLIASANALQYRRMDFEEFCDAALSVHQLEALDCWEQNARCAYELFEKDGNRAIFIEELAPELRLGPSIPIPLHVVLHDWIWHTDGKITAGASLVTSLNAVFLIFCA